MPGNEWAGSRHVDHSIHSHPLPQASPRRQHTVSSHNSQVGTREETNSVAANGLCATTGQMLEQTTTNNSEARTGVTTLDDAEQSSLATWEMLRRRGRSVEMTDAASHSEGRQPSVSVYPPRSTWRRNRISSHFSQSTINLANIDIALQVFDRLGHAHESIDAENSSVSSNDSSTTLLRRPETLGNRSMNSVDTQEAMGGRTASCDSEDSDDLKERSAHRERRLQRRRLDPEGIRRRIEERLGETERERNVNLLRRVSRLRRNRANNRSIIEDWAYMYRPVIKRAYDSWYCAECHEKIFHDVQRSDSKVHVRPSMEDYVGYSNVTERGLIHRLGYRYNDSHPVTTVALHFVGGGQDCYNCTWRNAFGLVQA